MTTYLLADIGRLFGTGRSYPSPAPKHTAMERNKLPNRQQHDNRKHRALTANDRRRFKNGGAYL